VSLQNYLVDGFRYAASALAAATVLRSLFGYIPMIHVVLDLSGR
jgi:hypothetical protein